MVNHKKILHLIGYYLAAVTPNPTDANAMQGLDRIYSTYIISHNLVSSTSVHSHGVGHHVVGPYMNGHSFTPGLRPGVPLCICKGKMIPMCFNKQLLDSM
jgi:hypothetical protein